MRIEDILTEKCWKGYKKDGMKTMFGKRVPNCVKNESLDHDPFEEIDNDTMRDLAGIRAALMPISAENWVPILKDRLQKAGYVYDKSQKKFVRQENVDENLRAWFGKGKKGGAGGGGWDRYNSKGERVGKCGDGEGKGKPKCLSKSAAAKLRNADKNKDGKKDGKAGIAKSVKRKQRNDPNKNRKGKAKNVKN